MSDTVPFGAVGGMKASVTHLVNGGGGGSSGTDDDGGNVVEDNDHNVRWSVAKFIPPVPESFSFVDENFHSDSFSVDGFVKHNSKRVQSLEKLKEELAAYLKILKHSMVELINEDYTEFINLSANLMSFDKSIGNIKTPVLKFKEETSQVQSRIENVIESLNAKQARLETIRSGKLRINMVLEIIANLNRMEVHMKQTMLSKSVDENSITEPGINDAMLDEGATLVARIQCNFDYLQLNVNADVSTSVEKNSNNLITKLKQRFEQYSRAYYQLLRQRIVGLLSQDLNQLSNENESNQLIGQIERIMRIYLHNNRQQELECIIIDHLVKPHLDPIVCDSFVVKHGVQHMYEQILQLINTKWAFLLRVLTTSRTLAKIDEQQQQQSNRLSPLGYLLLTNTVWQQFVDHCIVRTATLFSLANVDNFYHNYSTTFRFVEDFLCNTSLIDYCDQFESLKSYQQLKAKFNLNVYFHMRLQQIVPIIEKGFVDLRFSSAAANGQYRLNITTLIHENLFKGWQTNEQRPYFGDLFAYLWKISVKILSRFALWIGNISSENIVDWLKQISASTTVDKQVVFQTLAALIYDVQLLMVNFDALYHSRIVHIWTMYYRHISSKRLKIFKNFNLTETHLDGFYTETSTNFHLVAIKHLSRLIQVEITKECTPLLDSVNDIPRLYRRTNKEKPSKGSAYIFKCCKQLRHSIDCIGLESTATAAVSKSWVQQWYAELLHELCAHYKAVTLEVLTSVQKTEDSLKRLKKAKPPSNRQQSNITMTDDDKIRLQIYFDVNQLGSELQNIFNIDMRSIKSYHELSEIVSSLKILI